MYPSKALWHALLGCLILLGQPATSLSIEGEVSVRADSLSNGADIHSVDLLLSDSLSEQIGCLYPWVALRVMPSPSTADELLPKHSASTSTTQPSSPASSTQPALPTATPQIQTDPPAPDLQALLDSLLTGQFVRAAGVLGTEAGPFPATGSLSSSYGSGQQTESGYGADAESAGSSKGHPWGTTGSLTGNPAAPSEELSNSSSESDQQAPSFRSTARPPVVGAVAGPFATADSFNTEPISNQQGSSPGSTATSSEAQSPATTASPAASQPQQPVQGAWPAPTVLWVQRLELVQPPNLRSPVVEGQPAAADGVMGIPLARGSEAPGGERSSAGHNKGDMSQVLTRDLIYSKAPGGLLGRGDKDLSSIPIITTSTTLNPPPPLSRSPPPPPPPPLTQQQPQSRKPSPPRPPPPAPSGTAADSTSSNAEGGTSGGGSSSTSSSTYATYGPTASSTNTNALTVLVNNCGGPYATTPQLLRIAWYAQPKASPAPPPPRSPIVTAGTNRDTSNSTRSSTSTNGEVLGPSPSPSPPPPQQQQSQSSQQQQSQPSPPQQSPPSQQQQSQPVSLAGWFYSCSGGMTTFLPGPDNRIAATRSVCVNLSTCPDYRVVSRAAYAELLSRSQSGEYFTSDAQGLDPSLDDGGGPLDPSAFRHIIVIMPPLPPSCMGSAPIGSGEVGGSYTWVRADSWARLEVVAHEMQHNLGLNHARYNGDQYADPSCVMGYAGQGLKCLNAPHSWQRGWAAPLADLVLGAPSSAGGLPSGIEQRYLIPAALPLTPPLIPAATAGGASSTSNTAGQGYPRRTAVRLAVPATGQVLYISYRQSRPPFDNLTSSLNNTVVIHEFNGETTTPLLSTLLAVLQLGQQYIGPQGLKVRWVSATPSGAWVTVCYPDARGTCSAASTGAPPSTSSTTGAASTAGAAGASKTANTRAP